MARLSFNTSIVLAALLVFGMWACKVTSRTLNEENMIQRHEQWMARYGQAFNNAGNRAYKLSVNEFADQTNEEFKATCNGFKFPSTPRSGQTTPFRYENVTAVPSSIDWRKKGAVTPIKDQGQCAATEGITGITTGKLISLSEQELVDCDRSGEDQGCEGGYMDDGFDFIVKNKGINTEAAYPYEAADGTCNTKKEGVAAAKITGHEDVPANSEAALLKAVAMQPILYYIVPVVANRLLG
ncbi:putative actinidain [Helianthus anomalus]